MCSRNQSGNMARSATQNITIDLKFYLAFIYSLEVDKVLHFISEVGRRIICLLFCPLPQY